MRGAEIDGAVATAWYALESRSGEADRRVDTLVRVGAQPWAVAGEGYVLVASAPDPAATDLPLRATFLPWLDRVIAERLTEAGGRVTETTPGARALRVPAGVDALEGPDGTLREARAGETITAPWRTGVPFWRRGTLRAGAVVVNAEAAESELAAFAPDSLAALLGVPRAAVRAGALPRAVFSAGARRTLDTTLLGAALILLVLELVLARQRRADHTNPLSA